ncbi:hypothetical protein RRG08_048794 [Elysia crispata]|uniref:Uncharacterized protein n=1 Tax=Elysia crispata TaxID=231223 RepID=A0AAE1AMJ5_9GAST|nr:hypothetical protein RRG08_048794 [Elysia crispata]
MRYEATNSKQTSELISNSESSLTTASSNLCPSPRPTVCLEPPLEILEISGPSGARSGSQASSAFLYLFLFDRKE